MNKKIQAIILFLMAIIAILLGYIFATESQNSEIPPEVSPETSSEISSETSSENEPTKIPTETQKINETDYEIGTKFYDSKQFDKAVEPLNKACVSDDKNALNACLRLGVLYSNGNGVPQNYQKAFELYSKACNGNEIGGCLGLGVLYENGFGVKKNNNLAIQFYDQACKENVDLACQKQKALQNYRTGKNFYDNQQYKKAFDHLNLACDNDYMDACRMLGVLYSNGNGVSKNLAKANELFSKSCDNNEMKACRNLGLLYANGDGVEKNYAKAAELFQKACDGNEMKGCYNLAVAFQNGDGVTQNEQKAIALYDKACKLGDQNSCNIYKDLNN